ncbi:hypothetical protein CBR_g27911 [Chara braunii]|uniref:Uncharacterized protein n=1 Tax=Chara braunii TaxID=69332 RepID=A0A388L8R1_CHABU|nr:hypothetical protein CBR_g27911 [Chara braunii]|eukprot:GBG78687.1 hypothetical protein CBR_g27911 [Chara braunii]
MGVTIVGYNGGYGNNQRYNRQWTGGYRDREQERDDKVNRMYNLLSEQMEEREQRKQEIENKKRLEEEKKKDEEEKRAQAIKDREQHEARLGKIVRTSVKAVCESALGRKVDIPEDDEDEVSKLRRELGELRSKNQGETSEQRLEALCKEKDALLKMKEQEGEEERLQREIVELRSKNESVKFASGKQDEFLALQMQVKELGAFRDTLEEKNAEVSALRSENKHLKKDAVTEKNPPLEPAHGNAPSSSAMYTPKDLEALHKAYKAALADKEMALREAEFLKERMASMGAARVRLSTRNTAIRKTTPRNLKTSFKAMEVESDDEMEGKGKEQTNEKDGDIGKDSHDQEVAKMAGFRNARFKEVRQLKKAMEAICTDEGITYIKLEQSKADVAEIRASRDYSAWLKDREHREEEEHNQQYATSNEEVDEE